MADAPTPPAIGENPYLPPGQEPLVFDTFLGIDTSSSRPGIADEAMAWCDGFMPLGKNNLRVLPDVGPKLYDSLVAGRVIYFDFANIGAAPVMIVFQRDGGVQQVNTNSGEITKVANAGTLLNPQQREIGMTQWGSQYILFVSPQPNGYFVWDGTALYQAGTIAPVVTVTNSGLNYTSQPTIKLSGGSGSGATFTAQLAGGSIQNITIVSPGSGYKVGDNPIMTISGGGSDATASATANVIRGGGIQSVNVTDFGAQYPDGSYVTAFGGSGTGAQLQGAFANGQVTGVEIINPGRGYNAPPAIQVDGPSGGSGFAATATIATGQIGSATITSGGSGYTTAPLVTVVGDGVGATIQATIASGIVTALTVTNPGLGYTHATLVFSGGNNAATAEVDLMPFGVQGNTIETYQSRVWIGSGSILNFSAPESIGDFSTSSGGGFAQSTDSFLRRRYVDLIQTNGFLYLVADSSINYISGVQTSGVPPSTTYTNQNADPEIGTPYPDALDVFSRNIVLANSFGVHVSYGGAVSKISEPLDGVYDSVPNFGGFQPSSAKAIIFGKKVWMVLLPVIDPISGAQVNKLFMWNGKAWFSSQQSIDLTFIQTQEINSVLTAWGTDGQSVYPLFSLPSRKFTKTVQSKLFDKPIGYFGLKAASRFTGLAYYYSNLGGSLEVSIDNENGVGPVYPVDGVPNPMVWRNRNGGVISWKNVAGGNALTWSSGAGTGVFVIQPFAIAQNGALLGLTISTTAADMALISTTVFAEFFQNSL